MPTFWFIVPVHGRLPLAQICLKQLRRTCDNLKAEGVHATAVIVADETNHTQLPDLGFATITRDNQFLSRRFNDGIQLATDPAHNPHPADYVVPCGSDDWVDHRIFLDLPPQDTIVGFQRVSIVREDGRQMVVAEANYLGGSGIRIIPAAAVAQLDHRPADEDRRRACDTSILTNLRLCIGPALKVEHRHLHDRQIVDWKNPTVQLNRFDDVTRKRGGEQPCDPFTELQGIYPDEALEEMAAYYATVRDTVPVAA